MNPDRWQKVKELLNEALERDPEQRDAFLDEHCADDSDLRSEVASLLSSFDNADDFMEAKQPMAGFGFAPAKEDWADLRIGPYRVVEEIGRGGMGTVYRAVRADDAFRQQVAIKIVKRGMDHDFVLRRFRNERQILATLDHPNVARLLDGGATEDGLPYFVMEYIDGGKPINDYCDSRQLNTRQRLEIFRQVCSAVQAAHERMIVHRDIKPGNILVTPRGQPKLLDFGIAKILDPDLMTQTLDPTATILRLMTPEYASPEQVRGETITAASDVYSLGVLLYELLTGHRPYRLRSRSPHEIAQVICEEAPEKPSTMVNRTELVTRTEGAVTLTPDLVSRARGTRPDELRKSLCGDLDNIILKAMRKEAERRYPSAAAFEQDVARYLAGMPVSARRDTVFYRVSKSLKRNQSSVIVAAVALAIGTILMFAWRAFVDPSVRGPASSIHTEPLTSFPGDETQPAFSPDGSRIAFVWEGENSGNSDIYIKPVHGVGMERLTTNIAEDLTPTWSPDGKRIAWLRTTETETHVLVSNAQPGSVHGKVTSLYPNRIEAVGRHLDWGPDGKYLAAADKRNQDDPFTIVLIEVATGHKIQLSNPPPGTVGDSNPAFSPDGQNVAFIRGVSSGVDDIYIKSLNGGEARRLTDDKRYIISLAWSADGKHILFSSNRAGNHALWRVPASGGTPQRVAVVAENASDPVFSRDGKLMAFSQFYMDTNIWRMDLTTAARRKVIASSQYDSSPQYSPDGKQVVYRSGRSGTGELWISDSEGGNDRQLSRMGNSLTGSPHWSPDGTRVAFDSRPEGQPDIFVVNADGTDMKRLTKEPREDVVPSWSRDGKWVYFGSNRNGSWQVWKTPSDGSGEAVQVTKNGGFAAVESMDGKYVYYARGRSVPGLWRVATDGTGEERVTDKLRPGLWGYWALSSRGIYFADRESADGGYALYLLGPGRKEPARIAFFDKPLIPGDSGFSLSPDERHLLFTQIDQSGSDILLVENPLGR